MVAGAIPLQIVYYRCTQSHPADTAIHVDQIPPGGIFRNSAMEGASSNFESCNEAWIAEIQAASKPKAEQLNVVWKKCIQEQQTGIMGDWCTAAKWTPGLELGAGVL